MTRRISLHDWALSFESCVTSSIDSFTCDLSKFCRACLVELNTDYVLIDSTFSWDDVKTIKKYQPCSVKYIIETLTNQVICLSSELPHKICRQCFAVICQVYRFRNQYQEANDTLRKCLEYSNKQKLKEQDKSKRLVNGRTEEESLINVSHSDFANDVELSLEIIDNRTESITEAVDDHENDIKRNSDHIACDNGVKCKNSNEINLTVDGGNTQKTKFICKMCNKQFATAQTLARHNKIHQYYAKNKQCSYCGKCFSRSDDLRRHIRIHTGERPYKCSECSKCYKQISELNEHSKTHSADKQYVCNECGKSLHSRNGLYVHMKIHRGDKKFKCKDCDTRYRTNGELQSHIRHIHSTKKPFACSNANCLRAFATKFALKTHLKAHTHSGEKSACVSNREQTHGGLKKLQCSFCSKSLSNAQSLKKHILMHSESNK